jgi:hypothetical protein
MGRVLVPKLLIANIYETVFCGFLEGLCLEAQFYFLALASS